MTTSSECDKITFVLSEDKTYFTIISRRFSHGKRHDKGKSASGHSAVYAAADYRKYFPAALQHGRHDYRWPICRSGCTGCSWFYGNDYVPGAWICAGHHSRLYGSDIATVRCKDTSGVKRSVANGILLALLFTVVLTFFSMISMRPLLHLMNTPENIFQDAYTYIMIICGGLIATIFTICFPPICVQ